MTIILISKSQKDNTALIQKIAEDIWLLEDCGAISFIDLFIHAQRDSSPIERLKIATMGKIERIVDMSYLFGRIEKQWGESVATDQYKSGVTTKEENAEKVTMSIDKIEANISRKCSGFTSKSFISKTTGNFGSVIEITFNPPIEAGETRGLKICYQISNLAKKENSLWELSLYPHCSSGVGGVNFFTEEGVSTENMMEMRVYYIQVILPPLFDYDKIRSTKVKSEDYCYCDTCTKYCPYVGNIFKGISISRGRRLFLRWKAENLKAWTGESIIHLFYFSKPAISKAVLEKALEAAPKYSSLPNYILLILEESLKPISPDEIYQAISMNTKEISKSTIYYALNNLIKEGCISSTPQRPKGRGKPPLLFVITSKGRQKIE